MCYADNDEFCSEVWHERQLRGRKVHTCELCWLPIRPGLLHTRIDVLDEGVWSTLRVHLDCYALTTWLQREACHQHIVSIELGSLRNEVREHMREAPEVLLRYREVLRARRAEGVWPVPRAGVAGV